MSFFDYKYDSSDSSLLAQPYCLPIETFWQQYPVWGEAGQYFENYFHFLEHLSLSIDKSMESETVFIGSNTKNGRVAPTHPKRRFWKPKADVEVFVDGEFVQMMPLGTLRRFSGEAARIFPKLETKPEHEKDPSDSKSEGEGEGTSEAKGLGAVDGKHSSWAEDDEVEITDAELAQELSKLKKPSEAGETNASKPKEEAEETKPSMPEHGVGAITSAKPQKQLKWIDFYYEDVIELPPLGAFKAVFGWMHYAKETNFHEPLPPYGVPDPDSFSLETLVNLYAASLCVNMRPRARVLLDIILKRLTNEPPNLEQAKHVHRHIPIGNSVMSRMITSFVQHAEKLRSEKHTDAEWAEIEAKLTPIEDYMLSGDKYLKGKFKGIQLSLRTNKADLQQPNRAADLNRIHQESAQATQKIAQDLDRSNEIGTNGSNGTLAPFIEAAEAGANRQGGGGGKRKGKGKKGKNQRGGKQT